MRPRDDAERGAALLRCARGSREPHLPRPACRAADRPRDRRRRRRVGGRRGARWSTGPGPRPLRDPGGAPLHGARCCGAGAVPIQILAVHLPRCCVLRVLTADTPDYGTAPFPSMLIATFSVACYVRPLALAVPPVAAAAGRDGDHAGRPTTGAAAATRATSRSCASSSPPPGVSGAWCAHRSHQVAAARAESGERAREAVAEERTRIARELHDVVAHSVSIIAVQAGAAEAYVDRDPDRAREHIGAVRRTGGGDAHRDAAPARRAARGRGLVRAAADAGGPGAAGRGGPRHRRPRRAACARATATTCPPGIDLAAYRIVQEALTNVRRHAGGAPTRVRRAPRRRRPSRSRWSTTAPTAPGEGPGGGHGLVGMRERRAPLRRLARRRPGRRRRLRRAGAAAGAARPA